MSAAESDIWWSSSNKYINGGSICSASVDKTLHMVTETVLDWCDRSKFYIDKVTQSDEKFCLEISDHLLLLFRRLYNFFHLCSIIILIVDPTSCKIDCWLVSRRFIHNIYEWKQFTS